MKDFALIFDMDGVIVDNYLYHHKAWKMFCDRHGIELSGDFKQGVFGGTNKDHLEHFFNRPLSKQEIKRYENEKESLYREIYQDHIKSVSGLIRFLERAEIASISIALATSSPPVNVDFVLKKTGTKKYFSVVLDASDIKHGKPNPEIYLKTAKELGVSPEKCIVFEDSQKGIESAINAGMKVIALSTTHDEYEIEGAALVIPDFEGITPEQVYNFVR